MKPQYQRSTPSGSRGAVLTLYFVHSNLFPRYGGPFFFLYIALAMASLRLLLREKQATLTIEIPCGSPSGAKVSTCNSHHHYDSPPEPVRKYRRRAEYEGAPKHQFVCHFLGSKRERESESERVRNHM